MSNPSSTNSYTVKWGIISTGLIAESFVKDIQLNPAERGTTDIAHKITAVASRSLDKAQSFIEQHIVDKDTVTPYGTYQDLFDDPNVQCVYIGTPHPQHYENVKDALNAGKNVLCEKPFTISAKQATELFALAKQKELFVMEAVWTRFQPIVEPAQKVVFGGEIGEIKRIDSRFDKDFGDLPHEHRLLNPSLAGGALFDLGPYSFLWPTLFLFQHPKNGRTPPTDISPSIIFDPRTGVDGITSYIMKYEKLGAQATVSCSISTPTAPNSIVVTGTLGTLTLHGISCYPNSFTIHLFATDHSPEKSTTRNYPITSGRGMHWQADAVGRCLRDGKLEEEKMKWEETEMQQKVFDEVRIGGGWNWSLTE
ncbi:Dimeric dihydrodiol dehydrogenase [Phaffia rhodozyma]|uniref:D-xylose 1-dehydrogenase (NADP(+), D-xylono-1,5-lactone-forming) n=1 Tax=Phaffia rhodozyma TaxID=264483 RepID=A0A0F7SVZ3_PHARH|nr:Dimeric dihydrodiol dehydrogenase [Phaffia rhodozyma]